MLLHIGKRIILKHTKAKGKITKLSDGGIVYVLIDGDNEEIPIFKEDIIEATFDSKSIIQTIPNIDLTILETNEYLLFFKPVGKNIEEYTELEVFIINNSKKHLLVELVIASNEKKQLPIHKEIYKNDFNSITIIDKDLISDKPAFEISFWEKLDAKTTFLGEINLKIKPANFFKKYKLCKRINQFGYSFFIEPKKKKRRINQFEIKKASNINYFKPNVVKEIADFNDNIDLHIEKLISNFSKLSNHQILKIQINHFNNYIMKAYNLGIEKVFIIHGLGEGRLKDEIHLELANMKIIKSYKNEYNHRFGFGATEVIFN